MKHIKLFENFKDYRKIAEYFLNKIDLSKKKQTINYQGYTFTRFKDSYGERGSLSTNH